MGIASSVSQLSKNDYLQRFAGVEHISANDPIWNQLLSFQFKKPVTRAECKAIEESTEDLCHALLQNQPRSRNFASLLCVFIARVSEIKPSTQTQDNLFIWQATNALFVVKHCLKYFVENAEVDVVARQFDLDKQFQREMDASYGGNLLDAFIGSLMEIIVDVPVDNQTYELHLEAVNTMVILMSVQMFMTSQAEHRTLFQTLMYGNCSIHSGMLVKQLLTNFTERLKYNDAGGSVILGLASGLWSALTFGYESKKTETEEGGSEAWKSMPLALQSVHLLLLLVSHCSHERQGVFNPYRQALFSFTASNCESSAFYEICLCDTQYSTRSDFSAVKESTALPRNVAVTFNFDYVKLYDVFSSIEHCDQTTVLLYILLHKNTQFRIFVLSRSNIESIILLRQIKRLFSPQVMPILRTLYNAPRSNPQHIYMSLIILLILSEDDIFNSTVHDIALANVAWYQERNITKISLGGLVILVIIRTIQYNLTRTRDRYLHTNCLAALANMSGNFQDLHPYVSQRILNLFGFLAKRYEKLCEQVCVETEGNEAQTPESEPESVQDMHVLEEVLRMVLEIINSCLYYQLPRNLNLVYAILYQKEVFDKFRSHPTFQDLSHNIDVIINHFKQKVDAAGQDLSVEEVQTVIKNASVRWPKESLKKFPDLKFKYVEEEDPEEFFVPYIWSVVAASARIYWNTDKILLFNWTPENSKDEPNELVIDRLSEVHQANGVTVC
ncbi:unnamed protein product [Notodromas monacha]|uniref:Dymeclin n=1 Tax=Notodromas monacha TaxID=399045 RepID=A0A7R9GG43_9CRUS|nr:unnamed protein product [Notodromas monacha]CAG0921452.1 unnamed protein product [Notodromas monacha]